MALLGSSVDPRLFMQDYSGFARAAEIQAQGMQNLGAAIGQGIKDYGEIVGERKKTDAQIKADDVSIESAIKLGDSLGIDIKSYLEPIQALRKDPNTTPAQSLALGRAAAQGISNAFTLGIGAQEREIAAQRAKAEAGYKQGMLGAAQTRAAASLFSAKQAAGELKETEISIFDPEIGKERKEKVLIDKQGQYYESDTKRPILDKEKFFYGEEGGLGELPLTSQVAPSGQINQSALSSPLRQYAGSFEEYGNKYGVDPALLAAIAEHETGGGKSSAFRNKNNAMGVSNASGPIKMESVEASIEKMASLLGRGINEGIGPYANAKSIEDIGRKYAPIGAGNDPSNLNKFWTRSVSSKYEKLATPKQIDDAISMGGDMTQQAMGTPQQQAEAAQQIEQGAGMATAQTNQGVPTEPSMTTQQPKLPQPQRRMVRGIPTGEDKGKQQTMMTAEQVQNLALQGYKVNAIPNADGTFMVSGVTVGGQPGMEIEQTPGGGFRLVQGAGVGGRYEQAAKERQKQQTSRSAMGVQDAYRALRKFDAEVMKGSGVLASSYRKGAQFLPGTPEHKVAQELIRPLKDSIAKESLDAMRASSPSGGALGNSSNADIELLKSRYGALEIETDPVVWRQNLTRFIEAQLDVIHGTPEQRKQLVQEGKLTKEQYFDIESQYPAFTMSATGETVPRQMDGVSPQGQPADDENARIEAILRQHGVIPK